VVAVRRRERPRHERHAEAARRQLPQGLVVAGLGDDATARRQRQRRIAQRRLGGTGHQRLAGQAVDGHAVGPREGMVERSD